MPFTMKAKDLDDIYFKLNKYLFYEDAHDFVRGGATAHIFNTSLKIASAECTLNIHTINYAKQKWTQLNRLYLDPIQLGMMVSRLKHYRSQRKSLGYIPDIGMTFKSRCNVSGSCLMGITIGRNPNDDQWHCEIFSRASELTMRWYVDLIFMHVLIREIGKHIGFEPHEVKIHWRISCAYQSHTSMPWFLVLAGDEDWFTQILKKTNGELPNRADYSKWQYATIYRYWLNYIGPVFSKYKVQKRAVDAYHMFHGDMEPRAALYTTDLVLPDYDIPKLVDTVEEEEMWGARK